MQTTQQARREIQKEGQPATTQPRRISPVQELQPTKSTKKAVAEQAPSQ
jgi:hypothetical protein